MRMILQIIISNGILDLVTGILAKISLGTGIWYPPSRPSLQSRGNGTNYLSSDSPATISSTITEILFLLRRKCSTANIYLFPILPQFDHLKTHFATQY